MINSESSELKQVVWGNIAPIHIFLKESMFKCSVVPVLVIQYNKSDAYQG